MEVVTGQGPITLEVVYTARSTFQLSVGRDGRVVLRAPLGSSEERLRKIVRKKEQWILRCRERLRRLAALVPVRSYGHGARFHVLGIPRTLSIIESERLRTFFEEVQDGWILHVPKGLGPQEVETAARRTLKIWSDRFVCDHLSGRVAYWSALMGLRCPVIRVRSQRRLWGSCNSRRRSLSFNRSLFAFPAEVVDYVVIHELCHLVRADHSRRFWFEVGKWCPDWRRHRLWLKTQALCYCAP